MIINKRPPLTPFAMRVIHRLLDSSLTWREIAEAFSLPAGALEKLHGAPTMPCRMRPRLEQRMPRRGRPGAG
jgi:hypothetical protein